MTPLRTVVFAGPATDSSRIRPLVTPEVAPYHDGLRDGLLLLQTCGQCGAARLPGFPRCPWCGDARAEWRPHPGCGRVHSWTRYHRAFMTEFEPLVPYAVAAVELERAPVLFGRVLEGEPRIGQAAQAVIETWPDGFRCIAFTLGDPIP